MELKYTKGHKYQVDDTFSVHVDIYPKEDIDAYWVSLTKKGVLTLRKGFAWDGASGYITIQTKSTKRGTAIHDGIYFLMRKALLDRKWREQADKEMRKFFIMDRMLRIRVKYFYIAVRKLAAFATDPKNRRKVYIAP